MHLVNRTTRDGSAAELWLGDAKAHLEALPDESVDLLLTSPPYFVGKEYDTSRALADFAAEVRRVSPEIERVLRPGGSICWQVGNHVDDGRLTPLDAVLYGIFAEREDLILRNRIIWTFGHGTHAKTRFSGRHETILWYTKGRSHFFDLDAVRVPQKYPGKRHYKGPKKGEWSGHPLGKNPGDIWEIPNVKAHHLEKTGHPCQFPTALARRLIAALCPPGGLVVDPYMGSATTAVSALLDGRNFTGCDLEPRYLTIATRRLNALKNGELAIREDEPAMTPPSTQAVSTLPAHFLIARGG